MSTGELDQEVGDARLENGAEWVDGVGGGMRPEVTRSGYAQIQYFTANNLNPPGLSEAIIDNFIDTLLRDRPNAAVTKLAFSPFAGGAVENVQLPGGTLEKDSAGSAAPE